MKVLSQQSILKLTLLTFLMVIAVAGFFFFLIVKHNNGYNKILGQKELWIKNIKPNKDYKYWAYIRLSYSGRILQTIYQYGASPKNLSVKLQGSSLFGSSPLSPYQEMIVYLDNEQIKYASDMKSLKNFIGNIDTMQEALLIAYTLGYRVTNNFGTGYRTVNSKYEFVLNRYTNCPFTEETAYLKFGRYGIEKEGQISRTESPGYCILE